MGSVQGAMSPAPPRPRRGAVGAARFELYLARIVGAFGVLYALQTAQAFMVDLPSTPGAPGLASAAVLAASVLCGLGASVRPRRAAGFLWGALALFVVATVLWVLAIRQPIPATPYPYFPAVAVSELAYLAVVCRRFTIALVVGFSISAILGVALVLAGGVPPVSAIADALFLVAMTIGLTVLVTAVRRGVRRADTAQAASLAGYARTRSADATETERRRTDALLHDAVLTTYLAAAAAATVEDEELAARMAANARRVLVHVTHSAERGPEIPFDRAYEAIADRLGPLLPAFAVHDDAGEVLLPIEVADSMLQAMLEAMTNSVRHAHAREREVRMVPLGPDGLRITVRDDGIGFDASSNRLAASSMHRTVVDRLRLVDGRADVQTSPGHGCAVILSWGSVVMAGVNPLPGAPVAVSAR